MIDKEIIYKCLKGDRVSQKRLYEYMYGTLMPVGMRYYRDQSNASSAVNMTLIKVLKHHKNWKKEVAFDAWIKRIYINQAIDDFRKNHKEQTNLKVWYREQEAQIVNINVNHDLEYLRKAIDDLPDMQRLVFNLFVEEGMNHAEIGHALKISKGNSRFYLFDARKRIKSILETQGLSSAQQ